MTATRPSASLVHSIVATALARPGAAAHGETGAPRPTPESVGLDLVALSDFAGLAEKVRHNQVRHDLELTFRLLRLLGIEICFFRDFVPTSLARRRRGLTGPVDRLDGLAAFVPGWAGDDPQRCIVRDVLVHECTVARFRRQDDGSPPRSHDPATVTTTADRAAAESGPTCVPVPRGVVVVHPMICDPEQVAEVLRDRVPDLSSIRLAGRTAIYQRVSANDVRILHTDRGVGEMTAAIDGRSDIATIARRLNIPDRLVPNLVNAYTQLSDLGVIELVAPGRIECG